MLVCALAPLLLFLPVLGFQFVTGDDAAHVHANVRLLGGSPWFFWAAPFQGLYVPVTYTAWWLVRAIAGAVTPFPYHALNWGLHAFNAVLVYSILVRMSSGRSGAVFGALLFALHPLQIESVAWVSALKDVLCATGVLAALLAAWDGRWKLATAAFLFGLLAKPTAAAAPVLTLVLLVYGNRDWRSSLPWLGSWGVCAALVLYLTKQAQPGPVLPWSDRLLVAADSLGFSLAKIAVPAGLSLNYGRTPDVALSGPWAAAAAAVLACLLAWRLRRIREIPAALALIAAPWLLVSGLVSFVFQRYSTVADRFLYLGLLGPALGLAALSARRSWIGIVAVASATLLTAVQLPHWRDEKALYRRMAAVTPTDDNRYRYAMMLAESGHKTSAIAELRSLVREGARIEGAANNLALLLAEQGRLKDAELELERALALRPDSETLRRNLAQLRGLIKEGRP